MKRSLSLLAVVAVALLGRAEPVASEVVVSAADYGVGANGGGLQTKNLQTALDAAGKLAAKERKTVVVRLPAGRVESGSLYFNQDNVVLELPGGSVLAGSSNWRDYGSGAGGWDCAFITARGRRNIGLRGRGTLECNGVESPNGEQHYRGPHGISAADCTGVSVSGITIHDAGNYAFFCRNGANIRLDGVTIQAGHDGLHAQNCRGIRIARCDFRTADDCVAGADNVDVVVERCRFNSTCNAFRFGVKDFTVRNCVFQGPGEYPHKLFVREGRDRRDMHAAFSHFSPPDRNPRHHSDNWLVEDCIMDRVRSLYEYNHVAGTWQNGLPAKKLVFRRVTATNLSRPLEVVGDSGRSFDLTLEDVKLGLCPEEGSRSVIDLFCIHALRIRNLDLRNGGQSPLLRVRVSDLVEWTDADEQSLGGRTESGDIRKWSKVASLSAAP